MRTQSLVTLALTIVAVVLFPFSPMASVALLSAWGLGLVALNDYAPHRRTLRLPATACVATRHARSERLVLAA
jgi:hypothetical protein